MKKSVECKVCGKSLKRLNATHLSVHRMTVADYRRAYPDAELVSEAGRARHSTVMKEIHANRQWFSEDARKSVSDKLKKRHVAGFMRGKNHWSHGKLKFRGEFIPEDEVKTILAEFREQDLTLAEMAEECGVDRKTITNQLRRFGLQGGLRSGSRTPQWKGGHTKYRGPGWLTIRQEILERDGYKCTVCGMTQEEARANGHGLSVHHIVPFEQTQDNSPENLITLCQKHHMIAEWELGSHTKGEDK